MPESDGQTGDTFNTRVGHTLTALGQVGENWPRVETEHEYSRQADLVGPTPDGNGARRISPSANAVRGWLNQDGSSRGGGIA